MAKTEKLHQSLALSFLFHVEAKVDLTPGIDTDALLLKVKDQFKDKKVTDIDGIKIDFPDKWVHLRKSNTEPIIRVYSEAQSEQEAKEIGEQVIKMIKEFA